MTERLADCAAALVELYEKQSDGQPLIDHLRAFQRQTGRRDPRLDAGEPPPGGEHLVRWYVALHGARQQGFDSLQPVSWQEIEAFSRVMRLDMMPWEAETLRAMDAHRSAAVAALKKRDARPQTEEKRDLRSHQHPRA